MQEEKIIAQLSEEIYDTVNIEEVAQDVTQTITTEYIEVSESEPIVIEVTEAPVAFTQIDGITKHNDLQDRNIADQHEIGAITGLQNVLNKLSLMSEKKDGIKTYYEQYAARGGFAEFRKWLNDDNKGVGYFVSLVNDTDNNTYVDICTPSTDVYGVTVGQNEVGFYGYQDETYNVIGSSGSDNSSDPSYAKVCLLGNVKVRITNEDYEAVAVGDYVVPNNLGFASCKSDNGKKHKVGFKVIAKGIMEGVGDSSTTWHFVSIALVPQNDNVNRVMEELNNAKAELNDVVIQVGTMLGTLDVVSGKVDGFEEDLKDTTNDVKQRLEITQEMAERADKVSAEANEIIVAVQKEYVEAVSNSLKALEQADTALTDIAYLLNNIEPLATWAGLYECILQQDVSKDTQCYFQINDNIYGFTMPTDALKDDKIQYNANTGTIMFGDKVVVTTVVEDITGLTLIETFRPMGNHSIVGFLAQAEKDHAELSSLISTFSENGTDIAAIMQKIDSNGAAIQQLVSHIDKYTLGEYSPVYGLTAEETYILQPGHIYVPTSNHNDETSYANPPIDFKLGKSYIWKIDDTPDVYVWVEYKDVFTSVEELDRLENEDLWYCWEGVSNGNKYLYDPETLYCWDASKQVWVAVASRNNNSTARVTGLIRQTADELRTAYTDLEGNVSTISQTVKGISSTVNTVEGELSIINQKAQDIMMGVYDSEKGSTYLTLLLEGMSSSSINTESVLIKRSLKENTSARTRYSQPPTWDGEKFVFAEGNQDDNGDYYFDSDVQTYYCYDVRDGYEVYGIGNIAMNSLKTRVTNTESEIASWTQFKADVNETMTSISQGSSETEAEIFSMVFGEYRQRTNANLNPTEDDLANIPTTEYRYLTPPEWKENADGIKTFIFDESNADKSGVYCLPINGDGTCYYKLFLNDGNIIGYEEYKMKTSNYASIMQKTDDNGSSIGLVAGDDSAIGSLFVNAINDRSEVLISADKIGIHGAAIFTDSDKEGYTVISGNYIGTGILQSNNYIPPLNGDVFARAGTLFNLDNGTINSVNFDLSAAGDVSITGKVTATSGYIGNENDGFTIDKRSVYKHIVDTNGLSASNYYFVSDDIYYSFELIDDLVQGDEITLSLDEMMATVGGSKTLSMDLAPSRDMPEDGSSLSFQDISFYCLYNDQLSLKGGSGAKGVYIAPDGIGLGNGKFYVDSQGNVTMSGDINMSNGVITWSAANSPVQVEYSVNGTSNWHKEISDDDYYARYSYDGGIEWTEAIKIRGEDGDSASVTYSNIKSALERANNAAFTIISDTSIDTVDIYANNIYGGKMYAGSRTTGAWYTAMNGDSLEILDGDGVAKIALGASTVSSLHLHPYITLGAGNKNNEDTTKGCLHKMTYGLWVGDSSTMNHENDYPGTGRAPSDGDKTDLGLGIFFDFSQDKIFKYENGSISEIGSSAGDSSVAVFG